MNDSFRHIVRPLWHALSKLEFDELIPHRLKRLSRRFLGIGFGVAALVHFVVVVTVYYYRVTEIQTEDLIELMPYPSQPMEILFPNALINADQSGGQGGQMEGAESSGDPGDEGGSAGAGDPMASDNSLQGDDGALPETDEIASIEVPPLPEDSELTELDEIVSVDVPPMRSPVDDPPLPEDIEPPEADEIAAVDDPPLPEETATTT